MNTFYVSPEGSDHNPGTISRPFLTISKARDAVRKINRNMTEDIIVYLRDGIYEQSGPLAFCNKDSGTNGFNIIYKSYESEAPIVSGSKKVTGWALYDNGRNIYRASVDSTDSFRQIYVNGTRATRSRYPNIGSFPIHEWDDTKKVIKLGKSYFSGWSNISSVEIAVRGEWMLHYLRIKSYSTDEAYVYIALHDSDNDTDSGIFKLEAPYFRNNELWFENAYEFVDEVGEWYLDVSNHYLYYKPRYGENMDTAEVYVPVAEKIITLQGASTSDMLHNIQFYGIKFMYSNWIGPSNNGYLELQAGQLYTANWVHTGKGTETQSPDSAAIFVSNTNNLRVERCTFAHLGGIGIILGKGSHDSIVIGNHFTDIASNGIMVGAFTPEGGNHFEPYNPADTNEICTNITIKNNYISDVACIYYGCQGIAAGYVKSLNITHNEINSLPYTGIQMGWGWGNYGSKPRVASCLRDNQISKNYIWSTMGSLRDGGPIYVQSSQPNSYIQQNYVDNWERSAGGGYMLMLYCDNGNRYFSVNSNVVRLQPGINHYWIFVSDSLGECSADGNYTNDDAVYNPTNQTITNTYYCPECNWPEEAQNIIKDAGIESSYQNIRLASKPQPALAPPVSKLIMWLKADAGIIMDENRCVSKWEDQSGQGYNAVQSMQTNKPLWVNNGLNGKPALKFDGIDDYLRVSALARKMYSFTLVFVMKSDGIEDYNQQLGASGKWGQFWFHASANGAIYTGTGETSRIVTGSGIFQDARAQVFTYIYNYMSNNALFYTNGSLVSVTSLSIPDDWTGFTIGVENATTIKGDFAEILLYDKPLMTAERQAAEIYLNNKYNIY